MNKYVIINKYINNYNKNISKYIINDRINKVKTINT